MKKAFFLTTILFMFSCVSIAQADMMQVSWTGIISNMRPQQEYRYGLNIGDAVSIYAVYDDSSTEMHEYDNNGLTDTFDLSTYPNAVFLSDAILSFSDNLNDFIENTNGFSQGYTSWSWVYKSTPTGRLNVLARLSTVSVTLSSDGPSNGLINNEEANCGISGYLSDGRYNPIFFSSLTYSVAPYSSDQQPIPEPTTMLLFGLGFLGVAGVSRRKNI